MIVVAVSCFGFYRHVRLAKAFAGKDKEDEHDERSKNL